MTAPPEALNAVIKEPKDVESQEGSTLKADESNASATKSSIASTKWILVIVLVIGIVCAITIPLTLRKQNSQVTELENNASSDSLTNSSIPGSSDNPSSSHTIDHGRSYGNITSGPFNSTLELFSSDITKGYTNDSDLETDIMNAAIFFLGVRYRQNVNVNNAEGIANTDALSDSTEGGKQTPTSADMSSTFGGQPAKVAGSDFGTNNQEQGVEEGDVLVSDGQYVFAAYGKYLVIWSTASGTILKTVEMPSSNVTSQDTTSQSTTNSKVAMSDMMYYPQEPSIVSLVVQQGKLLVTVAGYEQVYSQKILSNFMGTSVRLYDIATLMSSSSSTAETGLIGSKYLTGSFNSIRVVNEVAHLVVTSYVDSYSYLRYPFMEANETIAEYDARISLMSEQLSLNFTFELMRELRADGTTPQLTRINIWDEYYSSSAPVDSYASGLLQSLVMIHSIDMSSQTSGVELASSSSGSFVPGWSQVYGASNRLILATSVWEYNVTTGVSDESVALLAFDISGGSVVARSVGRVPGSILNSYYIDVVGDNLRIAVTIRNDTMPMMTTADSISSVWTPPDTENYVIVMSLPSATSDTPGSMIELSRVKIGKPKESITAVRFFDTFAYALTAEKSDPFYVIDVSDPANLSVVAELEIPGFSSYLHPITSDSTKLLAIGENSNEDGFVIGLQLTVFDVSVPSSPKNISRYVLDPGVNSSVYSDSLWDFKSSRYYDGYLFLPVDFSNYYSSNTLDSFVGTMVFKIDNVTGTITEDSQCRISNQQVGSIGPLIDVVAYAVTDTDPSFGSFPGSSNMTTRPCNYSGYIPARSMIFDGNVMTTRQSEVIMTDLNTCGRLWNFTIGIPNPDGCQYYNW